MISVDDLRAPLQALQPGAHIHLIGVAGAGMNALASVLLVRGYRLSGSDMQRSAQVERLLEQGLRFNQGHAATHVQGADLVIISAAVREENVELATARASQIPVVKRAAALGWLLEGARTLAVAGTHGKTTTSSMLAVILQHAHFEPTFVIGGEVLDLAASARWGSGDWAVVEADEYDRSFLQLQPCIAVITNVEPDHLEYYGSVGAMHEAFVQFMARIEPGGACVINADDPYLAALPSLSGVRTIRCAVEPSPEQQDALDWYADAVTARADGMQFILYAGAADAPPVQITLRLAGRHNVANAVQAYAAARLAGVPSEAIVAALASFRGAGRRFEVLGTAQEILIIDDYAHHPTEIRANLAAARARFPERRLVVIFQPHTYSRTSLLFEDFVAAFDAADMLVLTDIYAARETDTLDMDAAMLLDAIAARCDGPVTHLIRDLSDIPSMLRPRLRRGDVVLTLGAGSITTVGPLLLAALRQS